MSILAAIAAHPELHKELKGIWQWEIDGVVQHVSIPDGVPVAGEHPKADVTVTVSREVLDQILAGRIVAQMAFLDGRLRIKGAQGLVVALFLKVLKGS